MRRTRIRHSYDKLHSGNQPYPLHAVTIDGHTHLGSVTAKMAPGVTVFCGVSGVGKTQFLNVLAAHLLGHGTDNVSVHASGIDLNGSTTSKRGEVIEHNHTTVRCFHVDTARECFDTVEQVIRSRGLDEKREAADKAPLSKDWASQLGYILNRDYDDVSFQGLDREDSDSTAASIWHYYELTYRGVTYGPHQMSLGELAASIVLRVLRSTKHGDILLLDEPENFLSPQARQRLLDVVVQQAVGKKLSVVIASHSIEIIRRLPLASLRTIEQGAQGVGATVANAVIPSQPARAIGLDLRPSVILLVEDNFAHRLLKAILARLLPALHLDLGIVESGREHGGTDGGEGAVVTTAKALWNNEIGIRVLGVLDGDNREQFKRKPDYLAFLPGTTCPEDIVITVLKSSPAAASSALGVTEETLVKALQAAEGTDIHDRPHIIGNVVGIDVSELVSFAAQSLVNSSQHAPELQTLAEQIQALLLRDRLDPDDVPPP